METPPPVEPVAPTVVPPIERHEAPTQASTLRSSVIALQQDVNQRMVHLTQTRTRLAGNDRRILDSARAFLAQSYQALQLGDLQRAFTLAEKASLLVQAVGQ